MNTAKKINVNVSSLVGLKAELLRKHTEVRDAKGKNNMSKPIFPKAKVKNKKTVVDPEGRKTKEKTTEIEDIDTLRKSKCMLIAKSKLYEKLKKSRGEGNENYLVDFRNKRCESPSDESLSEEDYQDPNMDPEEDWIDYKDCFGRTRRCLRKDLPRMKEKDSLIEREITKNPHANEREERVQPFPFIAPEKEPEIEIMRKKWEEQSEKLTQKSDIHYQDILFDEARAHGVGYYAFSHNEDERARQQSNLAKLRKETEQKQKEMQEIKDLKSKVEENRLKTARIRVRIRAGLPAEPTEEKKDDPQNSASMSTANSSLEQESPKRDAVKEDCGKATSNDTDSIMVIEDKIKAFGELLGKRMPWRELSQEEWVNKRRRERQCEFAPIYDNAKSVGMLATVKHNQLTTKTNDDPMQIRAGGPEPTDYWESSNPAYRENEGSIEEFNDSNTISTLQQTITPQNYTESGSFIHPAPPPSFNPAIPPPPVLSTIPSLPISFMDTNFTPLPAVLHPITTPSFMNGPAPTGLYISSSSYSTNSQQTIPANMTSTEASPNTSLETASDSGSNDSGIIGPLPPPPPSISIRDVLFAQIPLPDNPTSSTAELENEAKNPNIDKIAAGLKYLRQKFETNNDS